MEHVYSCIVIVSFLSICSIHAQLSISTSTPTPCYGDVVTLVCHHPEVANNPGKYTTTTPTWKENGTNITPSDGTKYEDETAQDHTYTTLFVNITVDYFGNKSFNYFCLLVLAGLDGQPNGMETSEEVNVNPVDLTSPHITNMDPLESSITVRWTPQPCAVRYRVSWMYTNDDGPTTTGSGVSDQVTNYTIPTSVQGVYTVSVQAVDGVGNVGPATSEVVRSTYPRPTADAPPCEDRSLVLTCLVSGLHNDRRSHFMWIDRNSNLTNSTLYTIAGPQLMIANVSALSGEEDKAIRCCEVLNNGIIVEGVEYNVEPLAQPGPPEVTITTTDSTITLTWNTALRCFEFEMFTFVVIWNEIGSGTSTNVTTSSFPYTISGLQPGTSYQISVQGVGGLGVVGEARHLNATTPAESPSDNLTAAIAITVVGMGTILTVVMVMSAMLWIHWRKGKHGQYATGPAVDEIDRQFDAPTSGEQTRTGYYAQVGFGDYRPVPAPPVELVAYANPIGVGEQKVKDTVPVLPPKQQDHHKIEKFRSDVAHALIAMGVDNATAIETGGVPHFTAEYNGIHFIVICVYTSSDVTLEDVGHILEAKQVTGSTKGLLMSNQSTIPSECLLTLEGAGCQFVPVSGYGEEGWEFKMIDKFKDVFPKVANDDSESEDLPASEQEPSPLSDNQYRVIQPRTGLARLLSPVGFTLQKRRNVPGGDWVESEEETTPPRDFCSVSLHQDSETHNDPLRSPPTTTIVSGHYSVPMPSSTFLVSSFEYKLSDDEEEEVFHKRIPQEEVEEEETMPIPVQETTLTTCSPPSTAASFANLEYPEEPLPTAASVASGECPEILPMTLTESSHKYSDVLKADDSNINPAQTSVSYDHTDINDMETLSNTKIKEGCRISVFSPWRPLISCFCEPINWFETLAHSELVPEEENKDSIISESADSPLVNQTPTQFSGETYGFLGGLETAQDPSHYQQNWRLWTSKKTESVQHMPKRNDMTCNEKGKQCYTLVHWSAHLFQTALHHSGALLVV